MQKVLDYAKIAKQIEKMILVSRFFCFLLKTNILKHD